MHIVVVIIFFLSNSTEQSESERVKESEVQGNLVCLCVHACRYVCIRGFLGGFLCIFCYLLGSFSYVRVCVRQRV